LHTDDVRNIPDRIKNMAGGTLDSERILNDVYRFINIGILVKSMSNEEGGISRRIEQICIFERVSDSYLKSTNRMLLIVDQGQLTGEKISEHFAAKFAQAGVHTAFQTEVENETNS
jgi:pilus assembly protein CpaF